MPPEGNKGDLSLQEVLPGQALNDDDNLFEEETKISVQKETESESEGAPSKGNHPSVSDGKGKPRRSKKRKVRVTEEAAILLVSRNKELGMILHALYVHRRLTVNQIYALFFQDVNLDKTKSAIRRLHGYGLLERHRLFSVAQTLAEARAYHYSLTPAGVRVYAYACMKVTWLHEDDSLPEQHFGQLELQVRKQADHHYIMQEFLTQALGRLWKEGIYIQSCDWTRYLFSDEEENDTQLNEAPYKPDWVLFANNEFSAGLAAERDLGLDILSVPIKSRNQRDLDILEQHYRPIIIVECDTGTMRHASLSAKCKRIKNEKGRIPRCVAFLSNDSKLGEERVRTRWSDNKVRVRNICMTIREVLVDELLSDEFTFLVGKQLVLTDITISYIRTNENLNVLFQGVDKSILEAIPNAKPFARSEWDQRKWGAGVPDFTYTLNGRRVACFYALTGWLNPQVKAAAALQATKETQVVLVYPTKEQMMQDVHLELSDRLSCIALDEWMAGELNVYRRIVDRKGERWEVNP